MKTNQTSAILFTSLALALPLIGCNRSHDDDDDKPAQAKAAPRVASAAAAKGAESGLELTLQQQKEAGIQVQPATEAQVAATIVLNGTLTPNHERIANVLPRLPGRILTAPVQAGAAVKAGQMLATIESIELGEAHSAYRQARSEANVAEAALERAQKLAAEDIIAQKDLQRARGDAERARSVLRSASDKLRLLGVAPTPADAGRDAIYPLTAPLTGTVIDKHAVPGALASTESLFTVADLSTLWLEADVFEKDLGQLKTGNAAAVAVAAYPERTFEGRLTYVSPTMDANSRTVKARIELKNPGAALKPGMFASARIASTSTTVALVLPATATTLLNDKPTVFVQTANGFEPRTVETVSRADGSVQIRAGLQPGEKVVVAGAYALKSRLLKSSLAKDD